MLGCPATCPLLRGQGTQGTHLVLAWSQHPLAASVSPYPAGTWWVLQWDTLGTSVGCRRVTPLGYPAGRGMTAVEGCRDRGNAGHLPPPGAVPACRASRCLCPRGTAPGAHPLRLPGPSCPICSTLRQGHPKGHPHRGTINPFGSGLGLLRRGGCGAGGHPASRVLPAPGTPSPPPPPADRSLNRDPRWDQQTPEGARHRVGPGGSWIRLRPSCGVPSAPSPPQLGAGEVGSLGGVQMLAVPPHPGTLPAPLDRRRSGPRRVNGRPGRAGRTFGAGY